jgi:hypothetical protein
VTTAANEGNEDGRSKGGNVIASGIAGHRSEWLEEFPVLASPEAYRRAVWDIILRSTFALVILAGGRWIPESYLDQIPWYWMDPDPVVRLAFFVCNVAACVYGAMAIWSFRCVFAAMWVVSRNERFGSANE